jgi:hypothetical protein
LGGLLLWGLSLEILMRVGLNPCKEDAGSYLMVDGSRRGIESFDR